MAIALPVRAGVAFGQRPPFDLSKAVQSYPVPIRELMPTEFRLRRDSAARRAAEGLESLGLGYNEAAGNITVRSALPFQDFELDGRALGAAGADSRDQWVVQALVENTNLAWINVAMDNNKVAVVYGLWYNSPDPAISVVRFEKGGGVAYEFQIEMGYDQEEFALMFPADIIYNPFEIILVRLVPRVTRVVGERLGLYCMIAEPRGQRAGGVQ